MRKKSSAGTVMVSSENGMTGGGAPHGQWGSAHGQQQRYRRDQSGGIGTKGTVAVRANAMTNSNCSTGRWRLNGPEIRGLYDMTKLH